MKEIWDIFDKDGNLTGKTIERGKKLNEGEYHLVVHIWIRNDKGQYLIQKRAENLKLFPGQWATTGGSAISGEDSKTAALRELREELGIDTRKEKLKKISRIVKKTIISDTWLIEENIDIRTVKLQKEEVSDVKWATKEEICYMVSKGSFHDYGEEYFRLLFQQKNNKSL